MTHTLQRIRLLLITCILFSSTAHSLELGVVLSQKGGAHGLFARALGAELSVGAHRLTDGGTLEDGLLTDNIDQADLILTSGYAATEALLKLGNKPILAALISRSQYIALRQQYPDETLSAIVLDQPPTRQIALMVAVLPNSQRFGILLGPDTVDLEDTFVTAASNSGCDLTVQRLSTAAELVPALDRTLSNSDALLALADPLLTTSVAARSVLLSSYRYRRPIFAHSRAYVDAGALAAVFSNPDDVARDISDWLSELDGDVIGHAEMRTPKHFDIAINKQVARALNIDITDVVTILRRLRAQAAP